jgi:uncharacterized membrane protein YkvA (DUF1232 family)
MLPLRWISVAEIIIDKKEAAMGNKYFERIKIKLKELKYSLSALYLAYKRNDVPIYAKIVIIIALGYALSPIDLIPDFIPVLGYLDDIVIVPLLVILSLKLIPEKIMAECREQSKSLWENGTPSKWYCAIPVVIIWLLVAFIVIKNTF